MKQPNAAKKIKVIVGTIVSLMFIYLAFRDVNPKNILAIIKEVNMQILVIPIIFSWVALLQRAVRWRFMLNSIKREKIRNLFSVMMVGYLGNNVFPARAGELVRIYMLDKNYGFGKSQSLATIVLEKVFDVLALMSFFLIVLFFVPFDAVIKDGGILLGMTFLGVISMLYLFTHNKQKAFTIIDFLASPFPPKVAEKIKAILGNFDTGLRILRRKKDIAVVVLHSVIIWLTEFFFVYLVLRSFNLHISIFAAVFLAIMLNIGMLIPSSPGYIGTYQIMCITALAPFGVDKEWALSISIVMHLLTLTITTGIGIVCFWREKFGNPVVYS